MFKHNFARSSCFKPKRQVPLSRSGTSDCNYHNCRASRDFKQAHGEHKGLISLKPHIDMDSQRSDVWRIHSQVKFRSWNNSFTSDSAVSGNLCATWPSRRCHRPCLIPVTPLWLNILDTQQPQPTVRIILSMCFDLGIHSLSDHFLTSHF